MKKQAAAAWKAGDKDRRKKARAQKCPCCTSSPCSCPKDCLCRELKAGMAEDDDAEESREYDEDLKFSFLKQGEQIL
jgi:hypothetical protein